MGEDQSAERTSRLPTYVTLVGGLLAVVLAVWGLRLQDGGAGWWDTVYRSMQMFVLDGGALPCGTVDQPPAMPCPVGAGRVWQLEVARFLAPIALAGAFLLTFQEILADRWHRWRMRRLTGHLVVCGGRDAALFARQLTPLRRPLRTRLAARWRGEPRPREVVLVATRGVDRPARRILVGDACDPTTLRAVGAAEAHRLYACGGNGVSTVAVALAAAQLRTRRTPLVAYVQVVDGPVGATTVRTATEPTAGATTLHFFSFEECAAAGVLRRHPVGRAAPLVCGLDPLGRAVVRAIVRTPFDVDQGRAAARRTLHVGDAAGEAVGDLAAELDVARRGWTLHVAPAGVTATTDGTAYVCLPAEDEAVATALRLLGSRTGPVVLCLRQAEPFRRALAGHERLSVFGVLDEATHDESIIETTRTERLARAIHQAYVDDERRKGETELTNPSTVPWPYLPRHLKESNLAQAEHRVVKLRTIGAVLRPAPPVPPFTFRPEELARLAEQEHERWMGERQAAGYVYGPQRIGRYHPDLRPWAKLPDATRQKDINAVERLPDLLAAEGLYIERVAPPEPSDDPEPGAEPGPDPDAADDPAGR